MAQQSVRRNPLSLALIGLIKLYQKFISPLTGPTCRFYPSCSRYAVEALQIHGLFKGTYLAAWRLLRCNPWNYGGVDDVPPRKDKQADKPTSDL